MNNILIFSDEHRCISSLKECETIDAELIYLKEKYNCDTVISLGDNFDSINPSSQELDQFARFIKALDCNFITLAANSHESTTQKESILNHYSILSDNITIVKKFKDGNHLYCGHFVIKESNKNYGAKLSKKDLNNYLYVFLGHQHNYEVIKPNICHLGSVRYVNFDEASCKYKIVALIKNYKTQNEQVHFLKLESPIPMIEILLKSTNLNELDKNSQKLDDKSIASTKINSSKELKSGKNPLNLTQCQAFLEELNSNTKVKIKILDFESFKQFLPFINKYNSKFSLFKYETNFENIPDNQINKNKKEMLTFKNSFQKWLNQQNIDNQIKQILLKEIE